MKSNSVKFLLFCDALIFMYFGVQVVLNEKKYNPCTHKPEIHKIKFTQKMFFRKP